ncbi:GNAT family N-acetyltransferase [Companilactobacillus halodurans]|uniref:GNAT family N-acetyltransferase n=1 Tax=Companilactobacillus halodurans TaxID=2584183 RepID=A0A5P0ZRN7_9LACO|nr:GNAT family N-acetyltransferase [Companilactobacillus halodurans]MQS76874.1 GNAT family N-acetyltransferase [Companilactobacillus halodurans]MQS98106.1 GNAT family N-acetyltransferase [Companilactobacillus halodurans]
MIRRMKTDEVDKIADIWLQGNLEGHNFINPNYWIDNVDEVKKQFQQSEIYVFIDDTLKGFVGMQGNYIAGIFVQKEFQQQGIGKKLLDFLKQNHTKLQLTVYEKNDFAKKFYQNNDFKVVAQKTDTANEEKELDMIWTK